MRPGLKFIFSHAIFISCCAAGLAAQTNWLLNEPFDARATTLLFLTTFAVYNCYRLVSGSGANSIPGLCKELWLKHKPDLLIITLASVAAAWLCILQQAAWPYLAISAICSLAYMLPVLPGVSRLVSDKWAPVKTILLALTWTIATTLIPASVNGLITFEDTWLVFMSRFCFMLVLCIIFDTRDQSVDILRFPGSLATVLGPGELRVLCYLLLIICMLADLALAWRLQNHALAVASACMVIITAWVYRMSGSQRGYYFYYFVVDGLMLVSTVSTFIATI